MTIKSKLRLAFAVFIGLFVVFGLTVLQVLNWVSDDSDRVANDILASVETAYSIDVAASKYRALEMLHVLSPDAADMAGYKRGMDRLADDIRRSRARYERLVDTAEERRYYESFARSFDAYMANSRALIALSEENQNADAATLIRRADAVYQQLTGDLGNIVRLAADRAAAANQDSAVIVGTSRTVILGGIAVVVLFGALCLWAVDSGIGRPIAAMTGTLNRLAEGAFEPAGGASRRADDLGQMARAVEATGMAVKALTSDLGELIDAANAGALSTRAETAGHTGEYARLVAGMNELIEGLTRPMFEVVEVMQLLAAGDLHGRMEGAYEGDLRALKANMNRSLDALVTLLHELGTLTSAMARGDLSRSVTGTYQGEFAQLKTHINQAVERLRGLIASIADDTAQTAVAITQTSAAARQVADESARQLATLNAVTATIGETASAAGTIAHNAVRGSELAARTVVHAEEGRSQLVRLAEAVERIAAAHGRIEQITGKIARISDKTHILSLNAGIEAARVGEQGVGFGIVAQQIGRLAEEAAVAAQDIERIIAESTQVVREGVGTTAVARGAVERIAEAAHESGGAVQAIAAAMTQQSNAIKDLHGQLSALQLGSEANAGAAEEISATMEELARMVHRTRDQIGRFTLAPPEPNAPCPPLSYASSASS